MIRKSLSVEEVMFDVRPEACKDIQDERGEEDSRQQTQQRVKPGVRRGTRAVEDLKERQVAGAGERREEMVTWSLAGLSSFWPVGP